MYVSCIEPNEGIKDILLSHLSLLSSLHTVICKTGRFMYVSCIEPNEGIKDGYLYTPIPSLIIIKPPYGYL